MPLFIVPGQRRLATGRATHDPYPFHLALPPLTRIGVVVLAHPTACIYCHPRLVVPCHRLCRPLPNHSCAPSDPLVLVGGGRNGSFAPVANSVHRMSIVVRLAAPPLPPSPGRLSTCHHCRSNRRHIGPSSIQGRQGMKSPLKTLIR